MRITLTCKIASSMEPVLNRRLFLDVVLDVSDPTEKNNRYLC